MSDNDLCACGTHPKCTCTPPLFDIDDRRCKACGTTKRNLCRHDADLEHGLANRTRKRPRSCLNHGDSR